MASLQTLRNKGGIIVAVVIGISLLAFILGDLLTSGSTLFGGGQNVGEINGTTITAQQYQEQVNTLTEVQKVTSRSETISAAQSEMIQRQAWQQLVMRYATTPELNEVGVTVGLEEMTDLLTGDNASPMIQQIFRNPETGVFDAAEVRSFVANVNQDPSGRLQLFWSNLQDEVHNQTQENKFRVLVENGAYITSQHAKFQSGIEGATFNIKMVAEKLSSVADSTIQINASEIKDYYNKNLNSYERPESRTINYVVFEALPSARDYAEAAKYMSSLKDEFEVAADPKQFARLNSQEAFDAKYYKEGELRGDLGLFAFSASADSIYAPEIASDEYVLAKISDKKMVADSMNISHILLGLDRRELADSLVKVIEADPSKYEALAEEFSEDQSTSTKGGEIGTLDPQAVYAQMSEALLNMKRGDVELVVLPTSLHILKVNEVKNLNEKVQLATIKYTVEPSENTRSIAFNKASNFASQSNFNKAAQDSLLSVRNATLSPSQRDLPGYEDSREVVRWAYNVSPSDKSDVMEFGNSFIVATLSKVSEQGVAPLEEVQSQIETVVRNEKKADLLADKLTGTVEQAAAANGLEVIDGQDVSFTTYIAPEIGFDPSFAGGVAALKAGQTSKPIKGKTAVYLVEVSEVISNPVSEEMIRERLSAEIQQNLFNNVSNVMLERSDIVDQRYRFF